MKIVIYFEYMTVPNTKLKVGVIGLGHQSLEDHIPAIKSSQDVELIGIVEIDKQKIKSFLKDNKDAKIYDNFDDLLLNQRPDFIIVAIPHHLHFEITKKQS